MVLGTELRCPGRAPGRAPWKSLSLLSHLSSLSYLLFKCEVHERWEQIKISTFEDFFVELSQIFTTNTHDFYNQKKNGKQVPHLVRG